MRRLLAAQLVILMLASASWAEKTQLGATIDAADRSAHAAAHRQADVLFRQKKIAEAEQELRKAVKLAPDYTPARYDLATLLLRLGRLEEGLAHFKYVAIKQRPTELEARRRYAQALQFANQSQLAIDQLTEALRLDPKQTELRRDLIGLLLNDNSLMQASNISADGVKARPNDASAHNNHGVVLMRVGKFDAAVDSFRDALELDQDHVDANYNMGLVLLEKWDLDGSETYLRRAIELRPTYADAHYNLGRTLARLGKNEDASAEFEEAIRLKQDYSLAQYQLGLLSMREEDYKSALRFFTEALRQNPGHRASKYQLGLAMIQLKRWELAGRQFESILQTDKEHAESHFQLARTLAVQGRASEAKSHFLEAAWLRPDWPMPRVELARLLAATEGAQTTDALQLANAAAIQLDRTYLQYLQAKAEALRATGKVDEAKTLDGKAQQWATEHQLDEATADEDS